ncbi:hypothetical protein RhiirA5_382268 [Rhizophagus irregularis]|uniref:Uncharacterized protein n=1 Tax=Rhizophagus irregularis TaxID=588596 RepID=A0A2I1F7A4_9GLOM|nr:hypothetical protein RhiirA5_382268 [Rhizophagus irregularis]PKC61805.1 hypothetical protein RhiirA1_466006 [Rhizophagus irregularis]PKY30257.1 hypothetical protein RhiirB3_392421 [Rhizophagus irregularis]
MELVLPNDSILSAEYETLGLIDNDDSNGFVIDNEDDEVWDDGDEDDSDDDHNILGIRDGHDYIACYGRDAWDKLIQAQEARHRNILLRLFTQRLPNISEQAKNGLFDIFTESSAFGVREHNALLDALADPVNGLSLFEYDQLYY